MLKNFKFCQNVHKFLIASGALMLVGLIFLFIFGANLDIDFTGGYRSSYSYSGTVDIAEAEKAIEEATKMNVSVSTSTDMSGSSSMLVVTIATKDSITADQQTAITEALSKKYPDNNIKLGEFNNVAATIGKKFFTKSLCAIVLAAVFVVIYVAIRFKNIGGASAAVCSLIALIHDVIIAFLFCIVFKITIDASFMVVVLTIIGYSLNNTIVIYDRVRENKRKYADLSRAELVDKSISETMMRSIITTITTLFAVLAIAIVSEVRGVTTLRSFAIPMAVGLIVGCYSTVFLAGPLWVKWREYADKKKANKAPKSKKRK